jgi:hypothetical protein
VPVKASSNGCCHSPTASKPGDQAGRCDLDPQARERWERFWTDALDRLKRYLEEP